MKNKRHLIIVDPTAFAGGSKVATESILRLLENQAIRITVVSADQTSWRSENINHLRLYEPQWLAQKEQGFLYFLRHLVIAFNLLLVRLRCGHFDIALGASGPGVDLSLYLLRPFMKFNIIQLIHGPVATSRTIARCLKVAHQVYYLASSASSLSRALNAIDPTQKKLPDHFHLFQNGLCNETWPTTCQVQTPVVFWAASLLKWKGLDTLLTALQKMPLSTRPNTNICYIRPQGVQLSISKAPINIANVDWYENPNQIDAIRAKSNIFISTSQNEPFGLSILEAMAAGQCVLIPADGAYWDQVLKNNVNCLKYQPAAPTDLQQKIAMLSQNMQLVSQLGTQAAKVARSYRASKQYQNIVSSLLTTDKSLSDKANFVRS